MPSHRQSLLLSLSVLWVVLAGCSPPNQTNRVATQDLMLNAVVMRHDNHLVVQATLNPKDNAQHNLMLQEQERIEVQLGEHTALLEMHWNAVYSAEIPFSAAPIIMTLHRQEGRNNVQPIQSVLYLESPEFLSPEPRTLFQTQAHTVIPLQWHGQPEDRGEYQIFCTDRTQGLTHITGSFATANRQHTHISISDLLAQNEALNQRALCEGIFTLRGISTRADFAPELGGGRFLFESNVSRPIVIRHNRMMNQNLEPS